jgi:hypothetical protein
MFTRLASRAAGSQGEVAEVVRLAGFLPLAISLLARLFARHRSWTLAGLAAETRASLLTLTAEHDSIAAAFEVSYRHLDPARQRFFRLLGLHPGASTDGYAAAALAGISVKEAAGLLDGLHGEGLLTETGHRRYGMHDLLRRYARDHAADSIAEDAQRALERLLDYYQHIAARAEARLARQTRPGPPPAAPAGLPAAPDLDDDGQALAWARADRASLLACLDHATTAGQHARVIALTAALAGLLRHDGPWADAITRHTAAAQAAQRLGDRLGQASALNNLGVVRWLTGDYRPRPSCWSRPWASTGTSATGVARPTRSMREGRCTGSAVTSRGLRGVTGRPWSWPALSPAPGTRLTRWPAWADAPWPTATPPKPRPCCGRHWRYSSASAQPKPRTCSPN